MGHRSLRDHLKALESRELLHRIEKSVSKDTELMPLVRWQYRGLAAAQRKAFYFNTVPNARGQTEAGVAIATIGASRATYACAMDCQPGEIRDRWISAQANPVAPLMVSERNAPVKEVIMKGRELQEAGLDAFPIPISTPGFDPAPYITSGAWVTKDPNTGIRNVGNYRGMIKGRDRLGLQMFASQHIGIHWKEWKARGKYMETAIVIGPPPAVNLVAVAKVPYGVDEYTTAGALAGFPIELVKCETVDLEVPAESEIVIEGRIPTDYFELEGPFGEFTGYVGEPTMHPVVEVSCITYRKRPIWHGFISQFPPSESSVVRAMANESAYYNFLKHHAGIGSVMDVAMQEAGTAAHFMIVIRMKKQFGSQPAAALMAAASFDSSQGKMIIAVDEDIDPHDSEAVLWALSTRMQPHLDMQIVQNRAALLDPSSAPPDASREESFFPKPRGASTVLIDATRKWDYPPTSLPPQDIMQRARAIWEELGLPALAPKQPWFGYPLGPWPEECDKEAAQAAKGRYLEIGERRKSTRQPV